MVISGGMGAAALRHATRMGDDCSAATTARTTRPSAVSRSAPPGGSRAPQPTMWVPDLGLSLRVRPV
eukprot:5387881-Prymnesium_polylepis.1